MTARSSGIAAVVLAASGGPRLERTLASVAWAPERFVLDPAGRVGRGALPVAARLLGAAADPAAEAVAPWLLLLGEGEVVSAALAEALQAVATVESGARFWCVRIEHHLFGSVLTPRGAPARLAPRPLARLDVRGTGIALGAPGLPRALLAPPLVAEGPASLEAAVRVLDAESTTLAALLHAGGARARMHQLVVPPLAAAGRVLAGRRRGGAAWVRWVGAVLAGYRAHVAQAKLWELEQTTGLALDGGAAAAGRG